MGLTINYVLSIHRNDAREARRLIAALRQEALGLPFQSVSEIRHFVGPAADHRKTAAEAWRWFLVQAQGRVRDPQQPDYSYSVPPLEVFGFKAWPGHGCEEVNLGLCLYPETLIRSDDTSFPVDLDGWRWASSVKTQYANDRRYGGLANFLACHLSVIALLDAAAQLGLVREVSDGGGYWEKRDVAALARTVGDWDAFIAAIGGALKDSAKRGGASLLAPILERPDFERLEAAGIKDPAVAKVVGLIRATTGPGGPKDS